jgi:hypothetical protein
MIADVSFHFALETILAGWHCLRYIHFGFPKAVLFALSWRLMVVVIWPDDFINIKLIIIQIFEIFIQDLADIERVNFFSNRFEHIALILVSFTLESITKLTIIADLCLFTVVT